MKSPDKIYTHFGNSHVNVTCIGKRSLELVLQLFFEEKTRVVKYQLNADGSLSLYEFWSDKDKTVTNLPFSMNYDATVNFLWSWLLSRETKDYGPSPDTDGSAEPEAWTIVSNSGYGLLLTIKPEWAVYGK